MGTPEFAVASLDAIMKSQHKVIGVVTVPDKPAGRGQKISQSAVKKYAVEHNLPVFQPEKMKNPEFLEQLSILNPDVIVVVAFRLLPRAIWAFPKKGTFNLHASLLPQYRGAAPINFAVINGDKESGVTTFFLDDKIDTGEILLQAKTEILPEDNAGILHDKLMQIGSQLVVETLNKIADNSIQPQVQQIVSEIKYAPKIQKEDCRIHWEEPIEKIHNLIRGMSPYPTAFTHLLLKEEEKSLKIYSGKIVLESHTLPIGSLIIENKKQVKIAANGGFYFPSEVQLEGKKRMSIADFLNGLSDKENLKVV